MVVYYTVDQLRSDRVAYIRSSFDTYWTSPICATTMRFRCGVFCINQHRHVVPMIGRRGMLCGLRGLAMTICGDKNITYGSDARRRSIDCVVSLYYEKFYHPSTVQRVNSF